MNNQLVSSSSSSYSASSFCIDSTPSWRYDVFLSFRGEDTRTNFTDHLYKALVDKGIHTFIDRQLVRGEEISPALLQAIEESRISLVIFSKTYAASRWCLDELVKILQCRQSRQQIVLPVFYKVDPSHIRNQTSRFGDEFKKLECKFEDNKEKILAWRSALREAANLSGHPVKEGDYEATLISNIVEDILLKAIDGTYLDVAKYPVGIQSCVQKVKDLLGVDGNGRRVVGIWGTSGIGKTTFARAVYNAIARKFQVSCFLADVRETLTSREGLIQLQKTFLSKSLRGTKWEIVNVYEAISLIKTRLRQKKILLILDDVDQLEQLKNWVDVDCFGEGSRVIITTKDRSLLDFYGGQWIYEVKKLEDDKALELFSWNAFERSRPPDDYLSLARRAIVYAQGLPLALNIIGSHLRNKCIDRWQAILDGYNSYDGEPYTIIEKILRKSYDAWDYGLQQVFLDIACFFKGENKDYVLQILRSSTLNVRQDCIKVLVEKAIITIEDNRILMHDLLQKMGKQIVYEESPTEPGKRSRLWFYEDVYNVLTENQGTEKIRSIVVEMPESNVIPLNPESFLRMVKLEIFINRNAHFSGLVDYLPNSLRWIDLGGQSIVDIKHTVVLNLSSNFHPRNLVCFDVSHSGIRQLKEFKNLAKLTRMNLSGCKFLEKMPDLSGSPNIIELDLSGCTSLVEVDDSVGFLDKLVELDLSGCSNLARFATRLGLRSLEELHLTGCTRLERFPEIEKDKMKSLTRLEIGESGIRELPSSIAYLTGLTRLYASGCELQNVPDLSGIPNIAELYLEDCTSLVEVHDSVGFLDKLEFLYLGGCSKLTRFPTRLGSRSLGILELRGCRMLKSFPEIEGKMESLWLLDIDKSGIRELPSIAYFPRLQSLKASGCELQNIQLLPFGKEVKFDEVLSCSTNLHLFLGLKGCNLSESDFLVPLDYWSALTKLNLSRNNFVSLPDCISKAVNLMTLYLIDCKRLREIPVLPPKLCRLQLNGCTSLEKIPKLPPRLEKLNLCNCSGLSGDEVGKLENNLLNEEIYPHSQLSIIYLGNEVPKWFSYTSNHPTTIQPLPEYQNDEWERRHLFVGGSEYRFEIPLKLQVGETLLGLALSFVLEPPTYGFDIFRIIINRKKLFRSDLSYDESTDIKATHVRVALVGLGEQEQQGDICQVVFRFLKGCPIKSCGVHCLLRNQDELLHLSLRQQLLQRQDPMQFQGRNPQLEAMLQQQRLRQQQQILQSKPQLQRAQLQQQQQQQQFQQPMQPVSSIKRPYDGGVCARRLMQYLYRQRRRPADNSIAYWRKFVTEYYSPRTKKRWCLSLYDNVGHCALGVLPRAAMDAWQCDICGSKSGRGFEVTFEVLPRLNQTNFGCGVIDELLFLDLPRECRFPSGVMMLEYGKAVQECVYEQLRVVREGQLRIIFTQDLKILSWEFCARRHEELPPRRLVAPQVNQLVQVAQKCQSTIAESGSDGISQQDLQTNSNTVLSMELQSLHISGFYKRYLRCLQISEAANSMKDLVDFCWENKVGPIEGLNVYPRHATAAKLQMQKMQEMEQLASAQGLPTDGNTLNKLMALHPGLNNQMNNHHQMVGPGTMSGAAQAAYQNLLLRQNSMNSIANSLQQEASSSFNNSNHSPSSTFQGAAALIPGSMQNLPGSALSSPHLPSRQPQQLQQRSLSSNSLLQQTHSTGSQGNQALQQQMIQQLLQEMSNNSGGGQESLPCPSANGSVARNGVSFGGNNPAAAPSTSNVPGSHGAAPSRNNSFKAPANSDNSTGGGGNNTYNQRAPDLPSNLHLQEDLVQDIAREFTENGFFNSNPDDNMYPQISSDIILRPTSSLGKRPHPRGSSDIVDDEYDHPKRRQINIGEEEEQEQPSASDDPQFQIS